MKKVLEVVFWTERELSQARYWKSSGFSIQEIAIQLKKTITSTQAKWDEDGFSIPVKEKVRKKCLKCSAHFDSEGIHNRLCDPCRENIHIPPQMAGN